MKMEAKQNDEYCASITVPLLSNENQAEQETVVGKTINSTHSNNVSGSASFQNTFFNGVNALSVRIFFILSIANDASRILVLCAGIVSIPYALASGGWLSLILLLTIASSTFYTGLLIQRCMDADPNIRSYPDIGERAFGTKGRIFVSIMMNLELYMVATGFLILEGDNLHNLLPDMAIEMYGLRISGSQSFIIIVSIIILPTVWLNNMSFLSLMSATGVLASIVVLGSILWVGAFDGVGFQHRGVILHWNGIPTAVSLYAFCYCAHPVFPTLYTCTKNKRQFSKVLLLCFIFCTIIYASMAIIGYLMFGPEVESQITLSIPSGKISSKVAIYTTLVNPIAKYALTVTPIVNAIDNRFPSYCKNKLHSFMIKTALVISSVIVALAIPFFGYLMSLVGAFLSVTGSILLPCLCYLKISGIYRRFGIELVLIAAIVIMGTFILIVGTCTSLLQIFGHL